jgi:hypothetical protein
MIPHVCVVITPCRTCGRVRYWLKADILSCTANVRFRGQSGHGLLRESAIAIAIGVQRTSLLHRICPLVTQSGHPKKDVDSGPQQFQASVKPDKWYGVPVALVILPFILERAVMRGRTCSVLIFLLLFSAQSRAETACVDFAQLAHSDLVGVRGTAWFQSPTTIVTAAHVASGMKLSTQEWKSVRIEDDTDGQSNSVRIQRVAGGHAEKLGVLELQTAVSTARSVAVRMSPLVPEDRVVTFAYPNQRPRTVAGRFVQYADTGRLAGTALFEIYEGDNRLVIDHGASGAPVFDCEGRVAAVISTVITQILSTPFGNRRVSTAWGSPNVVSVPIQQLMEFSKAQ